MPARPERIAIVGTGGHGREIAWLAEQVGVARDKIAFVVHERFRVDDVLDGLRVHTLESGSCDGWPYIVAVGDPCMRQHLARECEARRMEAITLVHPDVALHSTVSLGLGVVISAGAILTVNVTLADHVHVNVGATISHDCVVGRSSTISPGAHIAGHVHIGERVFVGIGAIVRNGTANSPLLIGNDATVAAGACVVRHVQPSTVVMGVPAKVRR